LKLRKRLKHIEYLVENDYDHIWDCCCDHGFLGTSLLKKASGRTIHFVDVVPEIITQLEDKLERHYSDFKSHWQTHCIDASKLPLKKYKGKHLIIIAGIGGDLTCRMIEALQREHPHTEIDYLLCPVNRQFALRQKLIELNFSLKDEVLIEDKKRFYEIIFVSNSKSEGVSISRTGEKVWYFNTTEQENTVNSYLRKTLDYYQLIQQNRGDNVDHIIDAYREVRSLLLKQHEGRP